MKRTVIILVILFISLRHAAGQVPDSAVLGLGYPIYSQYLQNGMMINSAYTGSRGALSAFVSYRMQWMGIPGSPEIQSVSLHTPMKNDQVALGILAQFMQFGYTKSSNVYASYAYRVRAGKGKLSFGLKAGFDRSNSDYSGISLSSPGDPVFTTNEKPYMLPNVGAGVYYFTETFFAGVAVPEFMNYYRTSGGSVQAFHDFSNYNFVFTAGRLITFSPFFKFKPSVLVDYSLQKTKKMNQLDINGNFILADIIWVGGSWRTTEEVLVGILQVQLNPQLMFGLSYDYPVGRLSSFSKGSSEFILRYEFGYRVSASNPRYF